ncbi:hypothetical protein [Streptomyces decoyicus]|uniref:hypothetical protein n=1 Tax=Streptomyces decoyicus TaxID=249567 RepID=UPI0038698360|nr:hypothetical protein OG532_34045 [Streptomyces decoyicus]
MPRGRGEGRAAAQVPGAAWLVDLPGDGSSRDRPAVPADPYDHWPGVLTEAAQALDEVVRVGHSTGGMFLLSVPELAAQLTGMALISSARTPAGAPPSSATPRTTRSLPWTENPAAVRAPFADLAGLPAGS